MSLSDLASVGSLVSGVAVLVSLIYLSLQIRQAERNQRALMQQGRANRVSDSALRLAEPGMSLVFNKGRSGDDNLTSEEISQFMNICRAAFLSAEDSLLHHLSGQLDGAAFGSFLAGAKSIFQSPGLRAAWCLSSQQYGSEFREFMNKLMTETSLAAPVDALSAWRSELAKQKAYAVSS